MKTMLTVSLFVLASMLLASCAPPTNTNTNTNGNTNANVASKPAAPSADSLMALEQKAWEAFKNKDAKYFEGFLADNLIDGSGNGTMPRAEAIKMITGHNEEIKSFSLSEPHVTPAGADAAVLTYKGTIEGTANGKPLPSPVRVATVFVRSGSEWKAVYHNEVPIIDPAKTTGDANKAAVPNANKDSANTEKKAPATPSVNSNTAGNSTASSNTNTNSNSAASSTDAALTDALMVIEKKGWEAWKAKDAKALDEVTASNFAFVDPMGSVKTSKADAMKMWTTDNPCTVSSVALSDGKATSITKDAAILVVKGTAEGTCNGMKLEPLWNTTVFVKEGDVWKTAYIFETPIRKS